MYMECVQIVYMHTHKHTHTHTSVREAQKVSNSWYGYLQHSVMLFMLMFLFLVWSINSWTLSVMLTILVALIALLISVVSCKGTKDILIHMFNHKGKQTKQSKICTIMWPRTLVCHTVPARKKMQFWYMHGSIVPPYRVQYKNKFLLRQNGQSKSKFIWTFEICMVISQRSHQKCAFY